MSFSLFYLITVALWMSMCSFSMAEDPTIAKPHCPDTCGNVSIPFPFGIGKDCYHSLPYAITCNTSTSPPKPFLIELKLEVADITLETMDTRIIYVKTPLQRTCGVQDVNITSIELKGTPFMFSWELNVLVVGGCGASAVLLNRRNQLLGGCTTVCDGRSNAITRNCTGRGCCIIDLSSSIDYYSVNVFDFSNGTDDCAHIMLINSSAIIDKVVDPSLSEFGVALTALEWELSDVALPSSDDQSRKCYRGVGDNYQCYCSYGYFGNPYLSDGCQVPRECSSCKQGCFREGNQYYCTSDSSDGDDSGTGIIIVLIVVGSIVGLMLLCGNISCIYICIKRRKHIKEKEKFFLKNGGLLLKQQLSSNQGDNDSTKIYTAKDLREATNNYSDQNVLGRGAFGTVYKGILPNNQLVAIKKSKVSDASQVEQFINEVVILTQINHRNVVKLLGCCLETEVPLLVYEFIPNGTLFDHIHGEGARWLTWEHSVRIASEASNAIAYLHSAASMPIIHRDIKSSNILLDNNFTAKVADFGVSRLVPIDQSQVTTLVQGTFGYLDPEYFLTSHLSEKSDVYSFGVVLVELLTRRKPVLWESGLEDRNLAMHFVSARKENHLFDIIEPRVRHEASEEELVTVSELVARCLSVKGEDRPCMKDVARELEGLNKKVKHPWCNQQNNENQGLLSNHREFKTVSSENNDSSCILNMEKDSMIVLSSRR